MSSYAEDLIAFAEMCPKEEFGYASIMNPDTEDIFKGPELVVGMVVMIEDRIMREWPFTPTEEKPEEDEWRAIARREKNFWCRIESISYEHELVKFIGVYPDGTKQVRRYNRSYEWLVKRDSLPRQKSLGALRRAEVLREIATRLENGGTFTPRQLEQELHFRGVIEPKYV